MYGNRKYPIGIQTFEIVRKGGYVYFDKTEYVYRLADSCRYVFLSRPRRFGKSLLTSTLAAYFRGERELFRGLAIDRMEQEWTAHPVIHLDFSGGHYYKEEILASTIDNDLRLLEEQWRVDRPSGSGDFNSRLFNIVMAAYRQTGQPVVVLVDEYDTPMLRAQGDPELQRRLRDIMRNLFSSLKKLDPVLRFVFLTGITKFSQMSIFSELNNLQNISLDDEFAAICGITEQELCDNCEEDIRRLAEKNGWSQQEAMARLKRSYDGYHFAADSPDIYNPFSLLTAFSKRRIGKYWFDTGTPTFLLDLMRDRQLSMTDVEAITCTATRFDQPTETVTDPVPVLYQGGYLTIKGYDADRDEYTLGFPNDEVRSGFGSSLMQYIAPTFEGANDQQYFRSAYLDFCKDLNAEKLVEAVRVFFASLPYDLHGKQERSYQSLLYTAFAAAGADIRSEVKTSQGRIDLLLYTDRAVVLFELKTDKSAGEAVGQIHDRHYDLPFSLGNRRLIRIGLNFSTTTRTVENYIIE